MENINSGLFVGSAWRKGNSALKWDKVGEDQVIRIFANHFLREDGREGAVKEIEKDLADKISQVRIWV